METNTLDYLNRSLIDAIELAKVTGTNAVDFVKEQAPDIVNQLIVWEITVNALAIAIFLLGSCIMVAIARCAWKRLLAAGPKWNEAQAVPLVISTLVALVLLGRALSYIPALLKPIVAPKVWLLEYAADLLK